MKYNQIAVTFLISALLPACGNSDKARDLSSTEIVNFHRQFNESKFRELYKSASPDLKSVTTEADFIKLLELEHNKLGKQVSSSEIGSNVNFGGKTVVTISQNTTFEHGKGVESFRYIVSDNNCILQGYNITSNDLLIK
jgi:hypothetical protein